MGPAPDSSFLCDGGSLGGTWGPEGANSLGRKARGPQATGGNKLQVADFFPFSVDTWFLLNLTFLKL